MCECNEKKHSFVDMTWNLTPGLVIKKLTKAFEISDKIESVARYCKVLKRFLRGGMSLTLNACEKLAIYRYCALFTGTFYRIEALPEQG